MDEPKEFSGGSDTCDDGAELDVKMATEGMLSFLHFTKCQLTDNLSYSTYFS